MKITTVSASVRFSGAVGESRFKTIELSAEAALDGKETWTEAQASLYQQLGCQLKVLWATGQQAEAEEPASEPEPPTEHYCQEHAIPFKRYTRGENVWWSHRTPDGKWCREK